MSSLRRWTATTAAAKRGAKRRHRPCPRPSIGRAASCSTTTAVPSPPRPLPRPSILPLAAAAATARAVSTAAPTASSSGVRRLWPYTADLVDGILAGNRTSLSRAITLVESHRLDHRRQAELLLDRVLSARHEARLPRHPPPPLQQGEGDAINSGNIGDDRNSGDDPGASVPPENKEALATPGTGAGAGASVGGIAPSRSRGRRADAAVGDPPTLGMRLGIAGPPGAGKSSFIEVLGKKLTAAGNRVAVISIDPSSIRTGGSILGDKTRMHELSRDPSAFVRGCPARGVLGGISRYTHDVVLLCQVAGYDPVIVETVGLGQNEVEVEHTVDMLVLMLPPAGGDDLQAGSKKGIVEVADAIVVNKSDGELQKAARATANDYQAALSFARRKLACWAPPVLRCSALHAEGIDQVWEEVARFRGLMVDNGLLDSRRRQQAAHWMRRHLRQQLMDRAVADAEGVDLLSESLEASLAAGRLSPRVAAERLVDCLLGAHTNNNSGGGGSSSSSNHQDKTKSNSEPDDGSSSSSSRSSSSGGAGSKDTR
ncbi:unnamed protein product [Scytosiphon promiscuus]